MNDQLLLDVLKKRGSFYLYDQAGMLSAARQLQTNFPGVRFLYSIKANPAIQVLDTLFSQGFGADAASLNEVLLARERGLPSHQIYYSAPGKSENDLRRALNRCTVIADSVHELERISDLASTFSAPVSVGLRLNPNFTFAGDGGAATKFGVDEEFFFEHIAELENLKNLRITGIHVHAKSQELDSAALVNYYRRMFLLIERVEAALGRALEFVNFGSGIGIPWSQSDTPLDITALGSSFSKLLSDYRSSHSKTAVFIETGRFVTGPYGIYVTQVLDKKTSRGTTFVLLRDTLNGFSRPCVSRMVNEADHHAAPCEPLYAGPGTYTVRVLHPSSDKETVTLAGNLCTAADTVVQNITLPRMEIGDGIVFSNAGCYSAVMTPMQFASLTPPSQLILLENGTVEDACNTQE